MAEEGLGSFGEAELLQPVWGDWAAVLMTIPRGSRHGRATPDGVRDLGDLAARFSPRILMNVRRGRLMRDCAWWCRFLRLVGSRPSPAFA